MSIFWLSLWFFLISSLVFCHQLVYRSHQLTGRAASIQEDAAQDVIRYYLGNNSHLFQVTIDEDLPLNSFRLLKNASMDAVLVTGSSGVAACKGFYYYVELYCNGHIPWSGAAQLNFFDSTIQATDLPNVNVSVTSSSKITYYQNVCTWSYSFTWWDYDEWRRHVYWMALNGINLALAPFQELVWRDLYTEVGMAEEEINEHLAGPAFLAWQRMGNIRGWGGPLPSAFIQRNSDLQMKIIQLSNSLGITLALPAFAGHVPVAFKRIFPHANYTVVERWNRFEDRYCCPLFVDPTDPLFKEIGERFLRMIIAKYGTSHIYFADPFNEINPESSDPQYMAQVSQNIYQTMLNVDNKALWLLQGWMFVKNPFWSEELIKSFLTAVPLGRILVLDLQSEQHPQYERTNSYYGQPYIWCMLHNFGGTLDMHGSINTLNERIERARNLPNSTMVGVGITPEGIFQNYIMYDFVLKQAWSVGRRNLESWFNRYAQRRYGIRDANIESAMQLLRGSVYAYFGLDKISGKYTVCRRPSIKLSSMSWYELSDVESAWQYMLSSNGDSDLFRQDLVDVTRQVLQNRADDMYSVIMQAFNHREIESVSVMADQFLDLLIDMDRILATHSNFLLGRWLEAAKAVATSYEEEELFEMNARAQITTWGPNGEIIDYATKQWSGMFRDFFVPRWTLFFKELDKAMRRNRTINDRTLKTKILINVEIPFLSEKTLYPTEPFGDSRTISQELFDKWADTVYSHDNRNSYSIFQGH